MADLAGKITLLETKIKKLITLHEALKMKIKVLNADNQLLIESIHSKQEQIRQLEEGTKALKIVRSLTADQKDETDLPEMKTKINEMIKDIDKCLALLNK